MEPMISNPLQTNFNNLLENYPALKQFCGEVRNRKPDEKVEESHVRKVTEKFQKIVKAIDTITTNSLEVKYRVTRLLQKLEKKKPDLDFIKQIEPFLKSFRQDSLTPEKRLQRHGVELPEATLLSFENLEEFADNVERLAQFNALSPEIQSSLKQHFNPEFYAAVLVLKYQYEEVSKKFRSDDIQELSFGNILFMQKDLLYLLEKYRDKPRELAVIFAELALKLNIRDFIWNCLITPKNYEIEFIKQVSEFCYDPYIERLTVEISEKYKDDPYALAVISQFAPPLQRRKIWFNLVAEKNREIEFISHVDSPGAIDSLDVRSLFYSHTNEFEALIEKYKGDVNALVILTKIMTPYQYRKMFEEIIKPNDMVNAFLSCCLEQKFSICAVRAVDSLRHLLNKYKVT